MTEDLFDLAQQKLTPACLYHSPARGLAARLAEHEASRDTFGKSMFDHAWRVAICHTSDPAGRCQVTVLEVDVRSSDRPHPYRCPPCDCLEVVNELQYRGACRNPLCNWEGDPRGSENESTEDAHDHAWPGWRDIPVVSKWPGEGRADVTWQAKVVPLHPVGWLEAGGPIRTAREKGATRHNGTYATPWGGYDMGVLKPAKAETG
jgi:hypothetical protein